MADLTPRRIRRISLFGGPACGKSSTAGWLFAQLKARHLRAELVQEAVKTWAYLGRKPESFDQVFLFAEQMRREEELLRNGVDLVVTDSPVFLAFCYAKHYGMPACEHLAGLSDAFDEKYGSLDLFLERPERPYVGMGRYHTHAQALEMDAFIMERLRQRGHPYHRFKLSLDDEFLSAVLGLLREDISR